MTDQAGPITAEMIVSETGDGGLKVSCGTKSVIIPALAYDAEVFLEKVMRDLTKVMDNEDGAELLHDVIFNLLDEFAKLKGTP